MDFEQLTHGVVNTVVYSLVGLVAFALAFWIMEKLAPFSLRKEIEEDHNTALAIIMSAVILGISLIIFGAVKG